MSFFKKFLTPISNTEENSMLKVQSEESFPVADEEAMSTENNEENCNEEMPVKANTAMPNDFNSEDISSESECELFEIGKNKEAKNELPISVVLADLQDDSGGTEETTDNKANSLSILSYFNSNGISIEIPQETLTVAPVESLAFTIAINYPQTKAFIRFMRESITRKKFEFTYALTSHTLAERNAIISLAEKLNEYGLISNFFNNKTNNTLRGTISTSPRCTNFINGDFLEMYARCVTVGVIKNAADKYCCDYELYHNILIHKGTENHELDIVFRLGDQVFWSEVKSGKFNPDEYRKLGLFMSLVPDKLVMLAAEKSNEAAEAISYFYEYYCANINTFKSTLNRMINKAMEVK